MSAFTTPELDRAALITIDAQTDVLDGHSLAIAGSSAVLPAMRRLLETFRELKRPVVHMVRLYRPDGSNVDLCRREEVISGRNVLTPGSPGAELAAGLVGPGRARLDVELLLRGEIQHVENNEEVVIYKPRWGAFYETPLREHLAGLGVSTLVFCGFNFPNCPRTSIYEASERDFRVILAIDSVSGLYARGREELANIGIVLMAGDEVIEQLVESPGCGAGAGSAGVAR